MAIRDAIEEILRAIPQGMAFDSHFVIEEVIEEHSDDYLRFASAYAGSERPTLTTHQQLGHQIKAFDGSLVERLPHESWSRTIHGTPERCALWCRI